MAQEIEATPAVRATLSPARRILPSLVESPLIGGHTALLDLIAGDFEVVAPGWDGVLPGDDIPSRCLDEVKVIKPLTATPSTVTPFQSFTLEWNVSIPPGQCQALPLWLGGVNQYVNAAGSMSVSPQGVGENVFILSAFAGGKTRVLGQASVIIDASQCSTITYPGADIRALLRSVVDNIDAEEDFEFSLRRDPLIEVNQEGIRLQLFVSVATPIASLSAKVDFDARIGLVVVDGQILPLYQSFDFRLVGLFKPVPKAFVFGLVDTFVKPRILDEFRNAIAKEVASYSPFLKVVSVEHAEDSLVLTVCSPLASAIGRGAFVTDAGEGAGGPVR